jgi:hypothetical protein
MRADVHDSHFLERTYEFFEPLHAENVLLVIGPTHATTGVAHPGCVALAPVAISYDSAYCGACRWQGRISGAWFMSLLPRDSAASGDTQP